MASGVRLLSPGLYPVLRGQVVTLPDLSWHVGCRTSSVHIKTHGRLCSHLNCYDVTNALLRGDSVPRLEGRGLNRTLLYGQMRAVREMIRGVWLRREAP